MLLPCKKARKIIDLSFESSVITTKTEDAYFQLRKHFVRGLMAQDKDMCCLECWTYYQEQKERYEKLKQLKNKSSI